MSISNPKIENPCKKFIDFKADKGQFFFFDKETEKQVEVPTPIFFIVLDELATITGYNKKNDCGIYSNEVHRTTDEILRVKTFKGGEQIIGKYNDIKDSVKALGGKYTKSVYALLINPDKSTELVNFKFKGASFSAWLEKKINTDVSVIGVDNFSEEQNGNTVYQVPVFKGFRMTDELRDEAIRADTVLQEYLKEYKAMVPEKEIAKAEIQELPEEVEQKFVKESRKQELVNKGKATVPAEDDLPF